MHRKFAALTNKYNAVVTFILITMMMIAIGGVVYLVIDQDRTADRLTIVERVVRAECGVGATGAEAKRGCQALLERIVVNADPEQLAKLGIIQGETGAKGEKGDRGKPGATGKPGANGKPGVAGQTGKTGASGPRGLRGQRGATGTPGKPGPQGPGGTGPAGATGPAGPRGPQGPRGPIGPPGPGVSVDVL